MSMSHKLIADLRNWVVNWQLVSLFVYNKILRRPVARYNVLQIVSKFLWGETTVIKADQKDINQGFKGLEKVLLFFLSNLKLIF